MSKQATPLELQQQIRDALDHSRQWGRLSAFAKETYENALSNMLLFASGLEGRVRHLRLTDRDMWVSYQPAFLTISAQTSGTPQVLSYGDIYVHVCTDHGQIWHQHIDEGKPASMMEFGDAELLEQVRFSMGKKEFDAISKGDILNSIAPTRVQQVTGGDPNWLGLSNSTPLFKPPSEDHLSVPLANVNDSFAASSGHVGALGVSLDNVAHINMHVSRLRGYEFFLQLSGGSNTYDAEIEFEKTVRDLIGKGTSIAHDGAVEKQAHILEVAGVQIDWSSKRNHHLYTIPVMNFIAEGATAKSKLYRYQFVEQSLSLLFFDAQAQIPPEMDMDSAWQRLQQLVTDTRKHTIVPDPQLIDVIDKGEYPSALLAKKWGLPNISKGQFQRAMHLFGAYPQLTGKGTRFRHPIPSIVSAIRDKDNPFAVLGLAKLPAEWFRWEQNGPDILTAQGVSALYQHYSSGKDELLEATRMLMGKRALPFLMATGKELDRLKGVQNVQHQLGEDDFGTKRQIRELGLQWRWMSSGPGNLGQRLGEFDEKYKVTASYGDYANILHQLWSAVYLRTLLDHDHIPPSESIGFSENRGQVCWDDDAVHSKMMERLDERHEAAPSNAEDLVDMYPSAFYEASSAPDASFVDNLVRKDQTDFRAPVRMNDELHKIYSTFLRAANAGSELNVSWIPLLDAPIKFPEFELHSISTRLELLTEGSEMKHCVFSYLNQCMSGESIILSAREHGTGNRIATIELTPELLRAYDPESPVILEIQQCYGYRNSSGEAIEAVEAVIKQWIKKVNNGDVPTNASRIVNDKTHMEDLMSIVRSDPANKGAMLQSIPYNEDGVFLAYYLFNKYTPDGTSIQSLVDQSTVISMVYHDSQFRRDIETIESIAQRHNQTPESVVQTKMQNKLPTWSHVSDLLTARQQVCEPIVSMLSQYDGQMTAEQLFQRSNATLAQHGLQFTPGYTANQFERDRVAGSNWLVATEPLETPQQSMRVDAPQSTEHPGVRRRA